MYSILRGATLENTAQQQGEIETWKIHRPGKTEEKEK
jgi:hypothetical protein